MRFCYPELRLLTQEQAHQAMRRWLKAKNLHQETQTATPAGLYLPVWTFDVGGEILWREKAIDRQHGWVKTVLQTSTRPVFFNDILAPASRKFADMAGEFSHYRLDQLTPYESGYLANWPAETYQLSTADASLQARQQAYALAQQQIRGLETDLFPTGEEQTFSSAGLSVESYKLILLPAWLAYYQYRRGKYNVFINGQTGRIKGALPRSGLQKWWGRLVGDE